MLLLADSVKSKKKLYNQFRKNNKQIFSQYNKLKREYLKANWRFKTYKREISNLPITPICFLKDKK